MVRTRSIVPAGLPVESARASEELLRSAFDRSPSGMSVVGLDGRWLRINDAYCRMLGYQREDLAGAGFCDFTHPDDVAEDRAFMAAAIAGGPDSHEREKRYVCKDGSILWARVRGEVIRDEAGNALYFVSHLQDISERRAAEQKLRESERRLRSVIDNTPSLISVKGRDSRYQLVNREFERFFGVSSDWIVGRGDQSVLPASALDATHAADRRVLGGETIQEEETVRHDGQERVFLTTRFPLLDDLGKIHAVCVSSTDVTDRRQEEHAKHERLQCAGLIYSAVAQNRLVLHGQPIVNLSAMQPTRVELLIRMLKVRDGVELVAPGAFLPAAERFGLIHVIDEWVIDRAIELAAVGHRVAVNVSAKTVSDPGQVDRIERAIVASGAPPQNLVFEITETAVADNLDAARTFAKRLRDLGCEFALDDFGVGHGSFTYLRQLHVDYLKIDIQFVRNLLRNEADRQVVQAIVGVARQFDIETIAEGVEDEATMDELRRMGVDYAQGFWIGRPVALSEVWDADTQRVGAAYAAQP
jgi:PAS domain S-box-containing protein